MNQKLFFSKFHIVAFSVLLCLSVNGQAQKKLYRTVMPDGTVVYTDTPPADAKQISELATISNKTTNTSTQNQVDLTLLPIEVRTPYINYPVTLYSTNNCESCDIARKLLNERGIPFIEYIVATPKDFSTIKERFSFDQPSFPILTVGSKVLTGYNSTQWDNYLDVAGFPKTSKLPMSYTNPVARPLTQPTPEDINPKENKPAPSTSPTMPADKNTEEGRQRPDVRF